MFSILSIFLLPSTVYCFREDFVKWIESNRITDFGTWGQEEFCPNGSYVTGVNLKIEDDQLDGDDTALNSIKLICTDLNGVLKKQITSSEGTYGVYRGREDCLNGLGNGFELRSDPNLGVQGDDAGAVDFNLICANAEGKQSSHVKGGDLLGFGAWKTINRMCPAETAICGIRTQVERNQGVYKDDTSLNNVDLACCRVKHPADVCKMQRGRWETVIGCGKGITNCKVIRSTGFTTTNQKTSSLTESVKLAEKLGFSVSAEAVMGIMRGRMETNGEIAREKFNSDSFETIVSQMESKNTEFSFKVACVGKAQELVLACGPFKFGTKEFRCLPDRGRG